MRPQLFLTTYIQVLMEETSKASKNGWKWLKWLKNIPVGYLSCVVPPGCLSTHREHLFTNIWYLLKYTLSVMKCITWMSHENVSWETQQLEPGWCPNQRHGFEIADSCQLLVNCSLTLRMHSVWHGTIIDGLLSRCGGLWFSSAIDFMSDLSIQP